MTWEYHQLSALLSERLDEQNEISEFCHYRIWLFDVGCGLIFLMNTTMDVKITCETLTNSPTVPLLPMQQILTLWIFATPLVLVAADHEAVCNQSIPNGTIDYT
jgi:hypothetical protein